MTILPKKKQHESRKSEQDQDGENRNRRHRTSQRGWASQSNSDEPGSNIDSVVLPKDIDPRDTLDGGRLPHKRSRHRPSSNYSSPQTRSASTSPRGSGGEDGYNSSDEHGARSVPKGLTPELLDEKETEFERQLSEKKGYIIKQMATDGACMFRSVADQVYGDQEMHTVVRKHCMDYMVKNRDFFSQYITEDFSSYIRRKRIEHAHGNHIEMQALSEMYNRPIEVYQYSYEPINTFHSRTNYSYDDNAPIRLSYHGNVHYNSVIDPYNPTVGVGLGLPGYKPAAEQEDLLRKTVNESETTLLEKEMLEDKIKATDWETTDEQIAELAARESYMQWLKDSQRRNGACSSTSTSSQSTSDTYDKSYRKSPSRDQTNTRKGTESDSADSKLPQNDVPRKSPPREAKRSPPHDSFDAANKNSPPVSKHRKGQSSPSNRQGHTSPNTRLGQSSPSNRQGQSSPSNGQGRNSPRETQEHLATDASSIDKDLQGQNSTNPSDNWSYALGFDSDWDNDPLLAAVLAQSQQEYLDSFTKQRHKNTEDEDSPSL